MSSKTTEGSVFRDLGKPKDVAENLVIRSRLMMAVQRAIKERKRTGETQEQVATLLGVDQPRISNLMRGRISLFSIDALVNMAVQLDLEVDISVTNPSPATPEEVPPVVVRWAMTTGVKTGASSTIYNLMGYSEWEATVDARVLETPQGGIYRHAKG